MPSEVTSAARARAARVSGSERVLAGPLKGYHHETYVFPLPDDRAAGGAGRRWKCREPREDLLWFDRRCFSSEEELVRALAGHITRIPEVIDVGDIGLQGFIEGRTLGSRFKGADLIPEPLVTQIIELFAELVRVDPEKLTVRRRCVPEDRPPDGDTSGFLERLICFTEKKVYLRNEQAFAQLFGALGIGESCFRALRRNVPCMTKRPFALLHGDLHRDNFIVDAVGRLWTIDWELAMVGDPLYDLATHLHLMRYRPDQAEQLTRRWCATVEDARPGSSEGWEQDLPVLLGYKRAQSVFTDVIRVALALQASTLGAQPGFSWWSLYRAARKIQGVLAQGATPLGLMSVPTLGQVTTALKVWTRTDALLVRRGHDEA